MEEAPRGMEIVTRYFSDFTAEQDRQFRILEGIYQEWNAQINVISRKDIGSLYEKHVLHSLSIAAVFEFRPGTQVIDIGTGGGFPGSVSLSCASGLPSGAACSFTNNPIPDMLHGPKSLPFEITTTARVTTPASLFHQGGPSYALWMPIFGAGLLGAGISRKRRLLLGLFLAVVLGIALLQAGCGSSGNGSSSTSGTPAGTYTVTVNATGGATRSTTVQLTVE